MSEITLDVNALQRIALFERFTGVRALDLVHSEGKIHYLLPKGGRMRIQGREGLERLGRKLGQRIDVVELREEPEAFLRSLFRPYGVEEVSVEGEAGSLRARVRVRPGKKGQAIGKGGSNLDALRTLAARHAGIERITLD